LQFIDQPRFSASRESQLARSRGNRNEFHDLRHTYASVLPMSGAALVSVQRLLGHSDPKITERRYGHLLPDFMASEVNRLRFGLDRLAPGRLGTSLVQHPDAPKREAGTLPDSGTIPASLVAGCRGLEPLASGVISRGCLSA